MQRWWALLTRQPSLGDEGPGLAGGLGWRNTLLLPEPLPLSPLLPFTLPLLHRRPPRLSGKRPPLPPRRSLLSGGRGKR